MGFKIFCIYCAIKKQLHSIRVIDLSAIRIQRTEKIILHTWRRFGKKYEHCAFNRTTHICGNYFVLKFVAK